MIISDNKSTMAKQIRKTPPANALEIITESAQNGCTQMQIAKALGVSTVTFNLWKERHPELREALVAGRGVEHDRLVGKLFDLGMKGNVTACIFLLKSRHGYVEGVPLVQNSVSVNFTLPGAMTAEQYVRTLTAEARMVEPKEAQKLAANKKVKKALKNDYYRERKSERKSRE